MKHPIRKYAYFAGHHPYILLALVLAITVFAVIQAGNVGTKSMENKDVIPDSYTVKHAFDIIDDEFGGSSSMMISIRRRPGAGVEDLRHPQVIRYIHRLGMMSEQMQDITRARSAATLLVAMNNQTLPQSDRRIKQLMESELFASYISDDLSHALIRLSLASSYDEQELVQKMQKLLENMEPPADLEVRLAGDTVAQPIVQQKIGPDMQRTTQFSIIGIIVVLLLMFWSIRYALTPLAVIIVGVIWAYGFFGLIGIEISSATSGAMSMIMGIGIDFGIQTVTRFRHELRSMAPAPAMEETLSNVFLPMLTTTLAALIGFRAMSMGDLSIMQDLATIMSYGVTACFLVAITLVPAVSVLGKHFKDTRTSQKKRRRKQ